jgi:hypothetical protein
MGVDENENFIGRKCWVLVFQVRCFVVWFEMEVSFVVVKGCYDSPLSW